MNQLANEKVFSIVRTATEHYSVSGKFWVHLLLAMPDHLHALVSFTTQERMDATIRNWKRFVAKQAAVSWQDGFFDHRLRHSENFDEKAAYIRANPQRAGLVSGLEAWPYVWPTPESSPAR